MCTSDMETVEMGLVYSRIAFSFSVIIALGIAFEKIFQSVGRMAVSMICMISGCIVNIVLDPVLIFGIGPIPSMGIKGAALATGIGQTATLVMYLGFYILRPIPVAVSLKPKNMEKAMCRKLYAIGIPASLSLALPSLLISSLNVILAAYSQAYVLVLGVYYKLQTFLYLPANGIVQGMRPLIGYNYGAEEYKRVSRIYKTALGLILIIMVLGTSLCVAIPWQLMGLFTENQETVAIGAKALRIISIGFIISSVSVASSGALEGLGMGLPSLTISIFRYVAVIIPISYFMSRILGPEGVWHGFWLTEIITAIISWLIYQRSQNRNLPSPKSAKEQ